MLVLNVALATWVLYLKLGSVFGVDSADNFATKAPPLNIPKNYVAEYVYSVCGTANYLTKTLAYPVKVWNNEDKNMVRVDAYDGVDSELHRDGKVYFRTPRIDKFACQWWNTGEISSIATPAHVLSEMSRHAQGTAVFGGFHQSGIPDVNTWQFDEYLTYNGQQAEKWTYRVQIEERVGHYELIISDSGLPLYIHMLGPELANDAHYDEYELNFTSFKPLPAEDVSAFTVPQECTACGGSVQAVLGDTDYAQFRADNGRADEPESDHKRRANTFLHHSSSIKRHNLNPNRSYTLAVNRFADWHEDEYSEFLGFRRTDATRSAIQKVQHSSHAAVSASGQSRRSKFQHTKGEVSLPESVDWRGSGAVGPVKDQGVCGSCWTFSASQAMSAAHWMATGKYVSLSEQQLMDCSWDYGENSACNGGDPDLAIQYVIDFGGSFREEDYPYKGADQFCITDTVSAEASPAMTFEKVVYIESFNAKATKEAVFKRGPLSVGVDAEPIPFRFYSSGVLDTPECSSSPYAIDHAVLLVGYGVEDGKEYWILKNEWSKHWGDGGFIKVAIDNDCGIATEAFFLESNITAS